MNYTEQNAKAIDRWIIEDNWEWGIPVSQEECDKARRGEWGVLLTPTILVPKEWFLPFKGTKLLGLASGGGQQMPIFSILGAECTVMDLSDMQLESEKKVAQREGYEIEIAKADMTKPNFSGPMPISPINGASVAIANRSNITKPNVHINIMTIQFS